jgi:hypothetical protein
MTISHNFGIFGPNFELICWLGEELRHVEGFLFVFKSEANSSCDLALLLF